MLVFESQWLKYHKLTGDMKSQIKASYIPRKPHHIIIKLQKKIIVKAARGNIYLQRNNNGTRLND